MAPSKLLTSIAVLATAAKAMDLVLVDSNPEAVCLDGSPPGYYWKQGSGAGADKWIVFFKGGGWCYTREACAERAKGNLGSSKHWEKTLDRISGVMSDDRDENPDFYDWNVAYIQYCDGASYAGHNSLPDKVGAQTLFYRGKLILDTILDDLDGRGLKDHGSELLVSGCSAGGLATYLHTDAIADRYAHIPTKAFGDSGFFMDLPNALNVSVYPSEMKNVFTFQNASLGVNQQCIKLTSATDRWHCFMAQYSYRHIRTPYFILNSGYDSWQMGNILGVQDPAFAKCAKEGPVACTSKQIDTATTFHNELVAAAQDGAPYGSDANGAFVHSCWDHCAGFSGWNRIKIGDKLMRDAVADWYFGRSKGSVNYRTDCRDDPTSHKQCNPSC